MKLNQTHTYVTLELSASAYDEIFKKMQAAEYDDAINAEGEIDMQGIAVVREMRIDDLLKRLDWAGGTGADLSPGDPLAREAALCIRRLNIDIQRRRGL